MGDIIAYKLENRVIDTQSITEKNLEDGAKPLYFDNSIDSLEIIRHSCAHLMAEAITLLYPNAKFFVGPAIEDGFYYDFRAEKSNGEKIGENDLLEIEKKMKELVELKVDIIRQTFTKSQILDEFKNDDLKLEVLKRIDDKEISIYSQGEFKDLCKGPHVPNTKYLRYFKLTRVAGAYLGGDETKEMLTRIYGTAFADKQSLNEYISILEDAKKRDHRKIGTEMKLFTFDEQIGAGLPIWLPAGARIRSKLEYALFKIHRERGYEPVRGPEILKADAWKISGHYTNYKENMYFTQIDEQEYGIKPMNCVGHIKIYQSDIRSYRDLPLKFFEYGVVHRHEKSGVMHGLFRVREFTQDDAHIFCMPSQIEENVLEILDFVDYIMRIFDFKYEVEISTKPQKAIGDDEIWNIATNALENALIKRNLQYKIDDGGGAFYGPKIDIKITDALKRKWQCGTIQVDFNLPQRFDLNYIDQKGERNRPVMLHRAILGSFERFIGILLEHTKGELPFFIAPVNVAIIPISQSHVEYAQKIAKTIQNLSFDVEIYSKSETLNKRIRMAEKSHVPMIIVIGDEEINNNKVALRDRRAGIQSSMSLDDFLNLILQKLKKVDI